MKTEQNINEEEQLKDTESTANPEEQQNEAANTESADNQENAAEENEEEKDPMEVLKEENEKLKATLLYKQAEFENYRKRTLKEKTELILNGGEKAISAILPVIDDFERALADKSTDVDAIREGEKMIYNKFMKTLESLGVKKMETTDADFNTDFHEAIAMVPGMGDDKKGKVIDCVQTGYTLNDKVIRHAKVAVGQ